MAIENKEEQHTPSNEEHVHKKLNKFNLTEKIRKNPWMLATLICGALSLILFFTIIFSGNLTGKTISAENAGEQVLSYFKESGYDVVLDSVKEVSGLYQVGVSYQGETMPFYITKDGENIFSLLFSKSQEETPISEEKVEDIPKSDKPVVDLYVMSFCPYGVRAENNIFSIVDLFKDKIDFNIRFIASINGDSVEEVQSLHGLYEAKEDLRQLVILNEYPDKFYTYLQQFNSNCYQYSGDDAKIDTCWKEIASELNLDVKKIETLAYGKEGLDLLRADEALTQEFGVSGSPTLIINDIQSSSIYSGTSSTQAAICSAFNEAPEECNIQLESAQQSASGSC